MDDNFASGDKVQIMQARLAGAEKDTKDLAKMLVNLGITPPKEMTSDEKAQENEDPALAIERLLSNANDLISCNKEPQKTVSFGPTVDFPLKSKENLQPSSILKKTTVTPLKLPMGENQRINSDNMATQYQHLVGRLCKTESIIQSLKMSLCALQTGKEVSEKEKNSVIQRLKEELNKKESEISSMKDRMLESKRNVTDADRRWHEAEEEVKSLQKQIQDIAEKQHGKILMSDEEMKVFRDKSARRVAEAKEELLRERALRKSLEESHALLLTRVNDVEENIEHERKQVANLREDCMRLKRENESYKEKGESCTKQAAEMENILKNLKSELDSKEKAIKKLVNEQCTREVESDKFASIESNLNKQIKESNIVLEAQKAAFLKLDMEKQSLQKDLDEAWAKIRLLEDDLQSKDSDLEQELRKKDMELRSKLETMQKDLKKGMRVEKCNTEKLEDRVRILEDCVQQQEKIIQEKEQEIDEVTEDLSKKLEEEKERSRKVLKEKEESLKAKELNSKESTKVSMVLKQEKELLQQQLCDLQLELDGVLEAKKIVEEENGRLMERSSAVQQQETAYKRMQDTVTSTNEAKSRLAYEKGKLQTRVEQLEEELQCLASTQSQLLQVKSTNQILEQRYAKVASELAAAKIEKQRMEAEVKQLRVTTKRKESEFTLAIEARDVAVQEKDDLERQMDTLKEEERNQVHLLKKSLAECQSDNAKMAGTLENVMIRHNDLQETLDSLQTQLGRKDTELSSLQQEREGNLKQIQSMHKEIARLQTHLEESNANEQARITPVLEALEKTRQENEALARSLDEVLKANASLKDELRKLQGDVEANNREIGAMKRREEALSMEAENMSQTHASRMQQAKEQHVKERDVLRKQLQGQITEMKKTVEMSQARCSQLTKGNADLRGRVAEKERLFEKLKEKSKSQKSQLDRLQREKQLNLQTNQKIKEISDELQDLDKVKTLYMQKNRQQAATINTFNAEVSSLKTDIIALGSAQQHAKQLNEQLEADLRKERAEKASFMSQRKELLVEIEQLKKEKQEANDKLHKVQRETIHVQENLNEAQAWFTQKFETLQAELNRSKGTKSQERGSRDHKDLDREIWR